MMSFWCIGHLLFIHFPATLSFSCLLSSYPSSAYWMSAPIIGSADTAKNKSKVSEKLRVGGGCDAAHPQPQSLGAGRGGS